MRKTIIAVLFPIVVFAEAPPKSANKFILPKPVISKIAADMEEKAGGNVETLQVSTTMPSVGQKVSVEAVIANKHKADVSISENFLGTERKHTLKAGEQLTIVYDYLRKLKPEAIAEYKIMSANFTLKEDKTGFTCVAENFHGTGCKVRPFRQENGTPSFRLSIPFVIEE